MNDCRGVADGRTVGRKSLLVLVLSMAAALIDGFDFVAMALVVPVIATQWHVPAWSFGPVLAASMATFALGNLAAGYLASRLGGKVTIVIAQVVVGLSCIGMALSRDHHQLLIWRFAIGGGLGVIMPNIYALVGETSKPARRSFFMTLVVSATPIGAISAGIIAPWIVYSSGWQTVFYFGGICSLIVAAALSILLPSPTAVRRRESSIRAGAVLEKVSPIFRLTIFQNGQAGPTLCLWIIWTSTLFASSLLQAWVPSLMPLVGLKVEDGMRGIAFLFLGSVAGGLILSWAIDRFPSRGAALVCTTLSIATVNFALFLLIPASALAWSSLLLISGLTVIAVQLLIPSLAAMLYAQEDLSTGLGWGSAVSRIGGVLAPLAGGWAIARGMRADAILATLIAPCLLATATAAAFFVLLKRRSKAAPTSTEV